jgi:hypothetical protein
MLSFPNFSISYQGVGGMGGEGGPNNAYTCK